MNEFWSCASGDGIPTISIVSLSTTDDEGARWCGNVIENALILPTQQENKVTGSSGSPYWRRCWMWPWGK